LKNPVSILFKKPMKKSGILSRTFPMKTTDRAQALCQGYGDPTLSAVENPDSGLSLKKSNLLKIQDSFLDFFKSFSLLV
jgi:hypothetical protein